MTAAYHKEILIGLNEDTVRARRIRIKSTTPMKTTSRLHVITNATVEKTIPDRKYDDYHGSTRNDMLSLVSLPPYELGWNLQLADKIKIYNHAEGSRRVITAEACCSGFMVSGAFLNISFSFHRLLQPTVLGQIPSPSRCFTEAFLQTCGRTFSKLMARKV